MTRDDLYALFLQSPGYDGQWLWDFRCLCVDRGVRLCCSDGYTLTQDALQLVPVFLAARVLAD